MPKIPPPENANELWRWMDHWNVPVRTFADLVDVAPQHLSDLRRGKRQPSDKLKRTIERVTMEWERDHRVKHPRGVKIMSWFRQENPA